MKFYDITQELFSGHVYPGDTPPTFRQVQSIANGDPCNLTDISMCSHNGTHVDAPTHFLQEGNNIDQLPLEIFIGPALVADSVPTTSEQLAGITRLLLKGENALTEADASLLCSSNLQLIGVEPQSVGSPKVHRMLLSAGIVLLEGLVLSQVPPGHYTLIAPPLKLGGLEGAPCRAILIEE